MPSVETNVLHASLIGTAALGIGPRVAELSDYMVEANRAIAVATNAQGFSVRLVTQDRAAIELFEALQTKPPVKVSGLEPEHIAREETVDYGRILYIPSVRVMIISEHYCEYFPPQRTAAEWKVFAITIAQAFVWTSLAAAGGVVGNLSYDVLRYITKQGLAKGLRRTYWKAMMKDLAAIQLEVSAAARHDRGIRAAEVADRTGISPEKARLALQLFGGIHHHAGKAACCYFFPAA